jgi:hypothetical protein
MATYTYEQLKGMTVARLREIAQPIHGEHPELDGFSTMHKENVLPALCRALGVHIPHVVAGAGKAPIKAMIRKLKAQRDAVTADGDKAKLANIRHQIHALKRKLHRMAIKA